MQLLTQDELVTVDQNVITLALPDLEKGILEFQPDFFNFDEISSFYRLEPNKTFAKKVSYGKKKGIGRDNHCIGHREIESHYYREIFWNQ